MVAPDALMNAAWNEITAPALSAPETNELPPELAAEADQHREEVGVHSYFTKLALDQEKYVHGKIGMKNTEIQALYDQLETITDFLDASNRKLVDTKGDEIHMQEHSQLLEKVTALLPEKTRKLIQNKGIFKRQELEWICRVFTRHMDTNTTHKIDGLTKDVSDLYKQLEQLIPMLRDLMKRYLDHIQNIIRLSKPQ